MPDQTNKPEATEIKKTLWKKMAGSPYVMIGLTGARRHAEPMAVQLDQDSVDTLWFFGGKDNRLSAGGGAAVEFVSKGHDFFASMSGRVSQSNDQAQIDKLWNPQAAAWFEGGREDPNLVLYRFDIDDSELWETDISLTGRVKMLVGGTIKGSESSDYAKVSTTAEGTPA